MLLSFCDLDVGHAGVVDKGGIGLAVERDVDESVTVAACREARSAYCLAVVDGDHDGEAYDRRDKMVRNEEDSAIFDLDVVGPRVDFGAGSSHVVDDAVEETA